MLYQIKAIRKNTKPPVWRRAVIPGGITYAEMALVMEKLLDLPDSKNYEFDFYNTKERFNEHPEHRTGTLLFYYSYRHGADHYVDKLFRTEKSFSFRLLEADGSPSKPEYRVEIEKLLESANTRKRAEDKRINVHFPLISKQVGYEKDGYRWSDPNQLNDLFIKAYHTEKDANAYIDFEYAMKNLREGKGILSHPGAKDKNDRNVESSQAAITKIVNNFMQMLPEDDSVRKKFEKERANSDSSKDAADRTDVPEKYSMLSLFSTWPAKDLRSQADYYDLDLSGNPNRELAKRLSDYLLQPENMKAALLMDMTEEMLDAFEKVLDIGSFHPTLQQADLLDEFVTTGYIAEYTNGTYRVMSDCAEVYKSLLKDGFRSYFKKATWLLSCLNVFNKIYLAAPKRILYQMYIQNPAIEPGFKDFIATFRALPAQLNNYNLVDGNFLPKREQQDISSQDDEPTLEQYLYDVVPDAEYDIPSMKEINAIISDGYPSGDPNYQKLYAGFVDTMPIPSSERSVVINYIFNALSNGQSIESIYDSLIKSFDKKPSKALKKYYEALLEAAYRTTRNRTLKGNTPAHFYQGPRAFL